LVTAPIKPSSKELFALRWRHDTDRLPTLLTVSLFRSVWKDSYSNPRWQSRFWAHQHYLGCINERLSGQSPTLWVSLGLAHMLEYLVQALYDDLVIGTIDLDNFAPLAFVLPGEHDHCVIDLNQHLNHLTRQ